MIVLGIDPGLEGALAVLSEEGDLETTRMPIMGAKSKRIIDITAVARFVAERDVEFALCEYTGAMPRQGVASTFKFGFVSGQITGLLHAICLPHKFVTPTRWKKDFGLSADKELSRRLAIERFPRAAEQFALRKDEARAEAALIALWWFRFGEGRKTAA